MFKGYAHVRGDAPLMVVVDTSVFLHKLDQSITFDHLSDEFPSAIKANLAWLMSGNWLGDLKPLLGRMVFVKDTKDSLGRYWRTDYLRDLNNTLELPQPTKARSEKGKLKAKEEAAVKAKAVRDLLELENPNLEQLDLINEAYKDYAIDYKAGRKLPAYRFKKVRTLVYRYLQELNADTLAEIRYEADDMAASLVQTNSRLGNDWDVLLLTVDSDWLGMLNPNTFWVCMTGYAPVVRDTVEVINGWAKRRLGASLTEWRDIWDIKGEQGDKCDNLPPSEGKLLPVIDLLEPPVEYRYWQREPAKLQSYFTVNTQWRFSTDAGEESLKWLRLAGQSAVIRYLPDSTEELRSDSYHQTKLLN